MRRVVAPQQVPGRRGTDEERGGEKRRQRHVHQSVGERRVEDDLEPVHRRHAAVDDLDALRGLHPAVGREDPEHRDQRADRHHDRGKKVQAPPYPVPAKQHHPQETGFEEERGEYLVSEQGPGDAPGKVGEPRPVGAELIGHDQAGDHAHAEVDREQLGPEVIEVLVDLIVGFQPATFEHSQKTGQADGDRRKDDVKRDREGELNPRQIQRIQIEHDSIPRNRWPTCGRQ
ncbi:hypothetical protein D3C80_1105750 [compost metagenome]